MSDLFPGFSEDRYASVITALLALRKEKLSQNLDLAKLSEVLTDALPPIDEHELAAVAEGFERLDRRKDELRKLEAEVAAVTALARRQRAYARAVVAGVADEVREAESRRDAVTRAEREASSALDEAVGRDRSGRGAVARCWMTGWRTSRWRWRPATPARPTARVSSWTNCATRSASDASRPNGTTAPWPSGRRPGPPGPASSVRRRTSAGRQRAT